MPSSMPRKMTLSVVGMRLTTGTGPPGRRVVVTDPGCDVVVVEATPPVVEVAGAATEVDVTIAGASVPAGPLTEVVGAGGTVLSAAAEKPPHAAVAAARPA